MPATRTPGGSPSPSARSSAAPWGRRPSPHAFRRGKRALSHRSVRIPARPRWRAREEPAGPAPTIRTSCGFDIHLQECTSIEPRRGSGELGVEELDELFAREGSEHLVADRSEEHTSELQSQSNLVCRLLLEK